MSEAVINLAIAQIQICGSPKHSEELRRLKTGGYCVSSENNHPDIKDLPETGAWQYVIREIGDPSPSDPKLKITITGLGHYVAGATAFETNGFDMKENERIVVAGNLEITETKIILDNQSGAFHHDHLDDESYELYKDFADAALDIGFGLRTTQKEIKKSWVGERMRPVQTLIQEAPEENMPRKKKKRICTILGLYSPPIRIICLVTRNAFVQF